MNSDPVKKLPLKERLKQLLAEYGRIALVIYFTIFAAVYLGFLVAISNGMETDAGATVGTAFAAWLATKVTQPLRVLATLALTPVVGKLLKRRSSNADADDGPASTSSTTADP